MYISFMRKSWQLEISSLKKETNVLIHFCINLNWNLLIRKLLFTGTQIIHVHWSLTDWSNLAYTIKKLIFQNYQIVTNYSHLFFKTRKKWCIGISKSLIKKSLAKNFAQAYLQEQYITIPNLAKISQECWINILHHKREHFVETMRNMLLRH